MDCITQYILSLYSIRAVHRQSVLLHGDSIDMCNLASHKCSCCRTESPPTRPIEPLLHNPSNASSYWSFSRPGTLTSLQSLAKRVIKIQIKTYHTARSSVGHSVSWTSEPAWQAAETLGCMHWVSKPALSAVHYNLSLQQQCTM
jgi:hypothetical protein